MVDTGSNGTVRVYIAYDYAEMEPPEAKHTFVVYLESNGIDGLQRKDYVMDNTCAGRIPPDTWAWPFASWVPRPLG